MQSKEHSSADVVFGAAFVDSLTPQIRREGEERVVRLSAAISRT